MSKTIVWIEDDMDIIDPVVKPLEDAGHKIIRLHSVQEALQAVEQIRACDLILLDILLPLGGAAGENDRYSGLRLLRALRDDYGVTVPVVVFTVVVNEKVHSELQALGDIRIIEKPVRPTELKRQVEQAMGL